MATRLDNATLEKHGVEGVLKTLADSTAEEYVVGCEWYQRANRFCAKVAALTHKRPATVAAVIARLSPQVSWDDNRSAALQICSGAAADPGAVDKCYPDNVARAEAIAAADDDAIIAEQVLPKKGYARPKIAAFYRNISSPDLDGIATVDTWAIRVWQGDCMATAQSVTAAQSQKIQADYARAAHCAGLLTHELQAVVWVAAHRLARENLQQSLFDIGIGLAFKI